MFANLSSRSRNKSGTPKSRGSSTISPEDAGQLKNNASYLTDSRSKAVSMVDESTPPAKRLRILDAFDKTESEIVANPLCLEPRPNFPIQMLARNQTTEMADLKFRLNSLDKRHQSKILELELAASKKQEVIDKKERKIEDLEKSLVFLSAREKDYEERIRNLEKENSALNESLQASQGSEAHLKDEFCVLKEKVIVYESAHKQHEDNEKLFKQEMDIKLNTLSEEKELLKWKLEFLSQLSSADQTKTNAVPNTEENILVTLNRELNSIQNRCTELQEENLNLSSKLAGLKSNQDKYEIICEKYSALERKSGEYESEVYDLQKKLSEVESHAKSWTEFFSNHEEFDSIDSLWVNYNNCQEQLKGVNDAQNRADEAVGQLKQEINQLKVELELAKENAASISKLLGDVRNALSRAEKLNTFAKKESELLKRQLDINFAVAIASKDQSQATPQELLALLDETKELRNAFSKELK